MREKSQNQLKNKLTNKFKIMRAGTFVMNVRNQQKEANIDLIAINVITFAYVRNVLRKTKHIYINLQDKKSLFLSNLPKTTLN